MVCLLFCFYTVSRLEIPGGGHNIKWDINFRKRDCVMETKQHESYHSCLVWILVSVDWRIILYTCANADSVF